MIGESIAEWTGDRLVVDGRALIGSSTSSPAQDSGNGRVLTRYKSRPAEDVGKVMGQIAHAEVYEENTWWDRKTDRNNFS